MVSNILTKDRKIRNRKIILSFFALQDYAVTKKKRRRKKQFVTTEPENMEQFIGLHIQN